MLTWTGMRQRVQRLAIAAICAAVISVAPGPSLAQSAANQEILDALDVQFRRFLNEYWQHIKQRNSAYLAKLHPKLPREAHDLFFDVTLDMMIHAEATEGLEPKIECQEFGVCKVIYPQPNDSWAAQRFILHDGTWRWLDQ